MNQIVSIATPLASVAIMLLFALPSFVAFIRQQGFARALAGIILMIGIVIGLESAAVALKLPLAYSYNQILGYKLFGLVPIAVALLYPPLAMASFWLVAKRLSGAGRIIVSSILTLGLMIIGNSALSRMGAFGWQTNGPFYNVPLLILVNWSLISALLNIIMNSVWDDDETARRSLGYSGVGLLLFWAGAHLGLQQWIPGGVGIGLAIILVVVGIFEKRAHNQQRERREH